ncbi:hypothetical protein ABN034_29050 [Actinopolymorpha sp. B11F2]|uniref:hypothetical protein n=1 Tax=Actinopolymorpha sp. B11F2 TaxID=3160862 RepID=UPI0032E4687F
MCRGDDDASRADVDPHVDSTGHDRVPVVYDSDLDFDDPSTLALTAPQLIAKSVLSSRGPVTVLATGPLSRLDHRGLRQHSGGQPVDRPERG